MKNKKIIGIVGIILVILIIGAVFLGKGNVEKQEKKTEKKTEDSYMEAVYLKDEQGNGIFVQTDTEMPFFGTIPQELYDEKENKITEEDLNSGDVVKIWGNEAIAQSYPAQYPGITKIQIEEKENKEYIEKYGHYLEEFIAVQDETELPYLDISYKQPNALVTAAVDTVASYIWEYSGDDGKQVREESLENSVLTLPELAEIQVAGDTQAELLFCTEPEKVEVLRWDESLKMEEGSEDAIPEGETVQIENGEAGNTSITVQPGYIYMIKAFWKNGEVEYGFSVTEMSVIE